MESVAESFLRQATALFDSERYEECQDVCRRVIAIAPTNAVAWHVLGAAFGEAGRHDDAVECLKRSLQLDPSRARCWLHLGTYQRRAGRRDLAIDAYENYIRLSPDDDDAMAVLGQLYKLKNDLDRAANYYRRAIAINPRHVWAMNNLALIQQDRGDQAGALKLLEHAESLDLNRVDIMCNIGRLLHEMGQYGKAIDYLQRAIALQPDFAITYNNLGSALRLGQRVAEAEAAYTAALERMPTLAEALSNRGIVRGEMGRVAESVADFQKAMELAPDFGEAHFGYGMVLLSIGDYEHGWAEYQWLWRYSERAARAKSFVEPRWNGSDLAGKTILVYAEQGFGDTIHFCRFIPALVKRGGKVIFECQPPLVSLMKSLGTPCQIVRQGETLPGFDVQIPLPGLPFALEVRLQTLGRQAPYLRPSDELIEQWRNKIAGSAGLRVGIAWAGSPKHSDDRLRSMPAEKLKPLLDLPGMSFFSLQKDAVVDEAWRVADHTNGFRDFSDAAALICNLDLVISVDTAILHLAGALGKPAWALLAFSNDWRWMRDRDDSPWYPTIKLWRQRTAGDWDELIERVRQALQRYDPPLDQLETTA